MQKESLKFADSTIFEGMTSIRAIISGIENGSNNRPINKVLIDKSKLHKISKEAGYLRAVSSKYGYEIEFVDEEMLDGLTLGNSHGGIVAIAGERKLACINDVTVHPNGFYAMIQGIEDPYNFGYSLRSLYACGCNGIIVGERNWLSAAGVVCRSSAGASELMPIYKASEVECVDVFRALGYKIICADERTDNTLGNCPLPLPALLIVGGEKRGISKSLLSKADILVKIPYAREFRASLSAASAVTMFAYEIMRQNAVDDQ